MAEIVTFTTYKSPIIYSNNHASRIFFSEKARNDVRNFSSAIYLTNEEVMWIWITKNSSLKLKIHQKQRNLWPADFCVVTKCIPDAKKTFEK